MRSQFRSFWGLVGYLIIMAISLSLPLRGQVPRIDLGDIAAGGDGTGTASLDVIGINPETGLLDLGFLDTPIGIGDGMALQPVEDATSTLIDSVFIIESEDMPINTTGTMFKFPPEDTLAPAYTWGQILNNRIGGETTQPISIGGTMFEQGIGIHAAAGITYDLEQIRAAHGAEAVGEVSTFAGMGDSAYTPDVHPGFVTAYLILSNDTEILNSVSHRASTDDGVLRGKLLSLPIPPEAKFLTLASGAGTALDLDPRFYFNSGTFGDAFIQPKHGGKQRPGDFNQDGIADISDVIQLLGNLFLGDPIATPCGGTVNEGGSKLLMNFNGDANTDITDGINMLQRFFLGGDPHVLGEACVLIDGCPGNVLCLP